MNFISSECESNGKQLWAFTYYVHRIYDITIQYIYEWQQQQSRLDEFNMRAQCTLHRQYKYIPT